jgi:hypothetical protein
MYPLSMNLETVRKLQANDEQFQQELKEKCEDCPAENLGPLLESLSREHRARAKEILADSPES